MREITSHKINSLNDSIVIQADEPGHGNASHNYTVSIKDSDSTPITTIAFQNGPILEVGYNGISNEALLAIVEDRLKGFQSSSYACQENADALTNIQKAIECLHQRTMGRTQRNVEGTHRV